MTDMEMTTKMLEKLAANIMEVTELKEPVVFKLIGKIIRDEIPNLEIKLDK